MTNAPSRLFHLLGWATTLSFLLLIGFVFFIALSKAAEKEAEFYDQRLAPYWEAEQAFQHKLAQDREREELEIQERIKAYKNSPQFKGDICYE